MTTIRHRKKKLLDRACTELCRSVRAAIRTKHHPLPTVQSHIGWIRRFILDSIAPHSLEDGYHIRTMQQLLGHENVKTTKVCTHVLNRGGLAVRSPLD